MVDAPTLSLAEYAKQAREIAARGPLATDRELRAALLSSSTVTFLDPFLRVEAALRELHLHTYFGPFGQFEQELNDPRSGLRAFDPQVLVLFMRPEDVDADIWTRWFGERRGLAALMEIVDRIVACVESFRRDSHAPVLVANFAAPLHLPLGPFDANSADSVAQAIATANATLRSRLAGIPSVAIWDHAGLVRTSGAGGWTDRRMWVLARTPIASDRQPLVAAHLARTIAALFRVPAKCLVLDLDNTLWGGVIGDDGLEGIRLGDDYPGSVFKSFQRAILGLADRGILLAVVSKNDAAVAEQAMREHPEMLIRLDNLSAYRINWESKSENLRAIAADLNIGSDALVLFDDNPVERAEVRARAPEVKVVEVPADPLLYERALHDCEFFDTPLVSQEDRQRVEMYRQERAREVTRQSAGSVVDFLTDLEMSAEVGTVGPATLSRVAQLVGKTNQFNLTTRRHQQQEIAAMAAGDAHEVVYLRLRDRFGDMGLIAVGIIEFRDRDALIDSFVMSCRAMGREAEVGLAAELVRIARARGCTRVVGQYCPTARNGIVEDLYPRLGFAADGTAGECVRWVLDLASSDIEWPRVIQRLEAATEVAAAP